MIVLSDFDIILLNSSAGKDSQTMLRLVHAMAVKEGVTNRLEVVHADLGRVEWPGTPELAAAQAAHYGMPFIKVSRRQNDLLEHVEARGKWPSNKQRYCTSDHKRGPIRTVMTRLVKSRRIASPSGLEGYRVRILNCMGMRAQESPARAKKNPFQFDKSASNGQRDVWNWLPIHSWTSDQVWTDIKASGVPYHPAYDLGMPRLSCVFCIFAPKAALMLAGKHNPELLAEYVRVENKTGHKFRTDISLAEVQELVQIAPAAGPVSDWRM